MLTGQGSDYPPTVGRKSITEGAGFHSIQLSNAHMEHWYSISALGNIIESLSSDVFERRMSTGSGFFAHLSCYFEQNFGKIFSIRVKTLSHTNLVASRHIKRKEAHFQLICVAQKRCCLSSLIFKTCCPLLWYLVSLNNSIRVHYLTVYLTRSQ